MNYLFKMRINAVLLFFLIHLHPYLYCQEKNNSENLHKIYLSEKNDSVRIEKQLQYIGSLLKVDKNFAEAEKEMDQIRKNKSALEYPGTLAWLNYYEALIMYYNTQYIYSID